MYTRLLDVRDVVVGRSTDAGLCLQHSSISRQHARLFLEAGHWQLSDLDSKNGSFIDGVRVERIA
ncbi:MAG: FHA domain-containing protein, partial [Thermomonas sp.]